MNKKQIREAARLSDDERREMKQEFLSFMDMHDPVGSAKHERIHAFSAFFSRLRPLIYGPALLMCTVIVLSEFSLPSEPLYIVKRQFNENIVLIPSKIVPEAEAWTHELLVKRRINEAETLFTLHRLEAADAGMLKADIEAHTTEILEYAHAERTKGDVQEANDAVQELEELLESYENIFLNLDNEKTDLDTQNLTEILTDGEVKPEFNNMVDDVLQVEEGA